MKSTIETAKEIPKPLHPRPERVRKNWKNLNGEWDFSLGEPIYDKRINVPFSWVSPLSGIGENEKGVGYYRLRCRFDPKGQLPFLVIGASDYETEVTVNGTTYVILNESDILAIID